MTPTLLRLNHQRRGLALILALVLLGLVAALGSALVRTSLSGRVASDLARREAQTLWLLDAGCSRARAQLAGGAAYAGETWEIPADQLDGRHAARVAIAVEPAAEAAPRSIVITVRAVFPAGDDDPTRTARSRRFLHERTTGREALEDQP